MHACMQVEQSHQLLDQQPAPIARAELESLRLHNQQLEEQLASAVHSARVARDSSESGGAEAERLHAQVNTLHREVAELSTQLGEARANLDEAEMREAHAQADVEAMRLEKVQAETRTAETVELAELEKEEVALQASEEAEERLEHLRKVSK